MAGSDASKGALAGRRAVVFGGSSGAGLATACSLASMGAQVAICGRDPEKLEAASRAVAAAAAHGGAVTTHAVDGKDEEAVQAFFEGHGELDHLVITAGQTDRGGPFTTQITQKSFRATFEGKFWPQVLVALHGARRVRRGGSVTFFSGAASRRAIPGMANVAAVNGAIDAMIGPLARELAPTRVNAVAPGTLDTPYYEGMAEKDRLAVFERMAGLLPVGRVGTAEDIAGAVAFLVTNGYVTGIVLEVDGGIRQAAL